MPKLGIFPGSTDESMPLLDIAQAAKERGYSGIFLNEHPHIPVHHPTSQFSMAKDIPRHYARFWDPYIALSFVAATMPDFEIGTCISLVAEHDAIALAKTVATLDALSRGRLIFGVGYGWLREEFEDHGHPANVRAEVCEETIGLMKAIWTQEVASYDGKYRKMSPSMSWPKPHQKPYPPVLLGVKATPRNFERIVKWGDGWIPRGQGLLTSPQFADDLAELRRQWVNAGRDPASLKVTAIYYPGSADSFARARDAAIKLGVERVVLHTDDEDAAKALPIMDEAAKGFFG